jgi:pyruvate formate lyase activating enzyme
VDPIEKKPLAHFLPGTPVLSFGTAGCNLGCRFCQNWEISTSREVDTLADSASPEVIARAAVELGCRSVAFTYNDPVVFHEYAIDVAKACRARGLKTVAVTAGEVCAEPRVEFYRHIDAANVDLKSFRDSFYREICASRIEPVLDTLRYLRKETAVWLEITTLLIPGLNDSVEEIDEMVHWIARELGGEVPLHFSAFHPDHRLRDRPATPLETLHRAKRQAHGVGLRHVYLGNVHDPDAESTYCSACGQILIGRDGYAITSWRLNADGTCPDCGTRLAGLIEPEPGNWGSRRRPVRLSDFQPN